MREARFAGRLAPTAASRYTYGPTPPPEPRVTAAYIVPLSLNVGMMFH